MDDQDLLDQLALFEVASSEEVRAARRPAGADLLVEFEPRSEARPSSLPGFWLSALWRFLEDSRGNTDAFEGLAFQATALRLSPAEFAQRYGLLRARLTLPPPYPIELREAYLTLSGRLISYTGITTEESYWAGFFQANVYPTTPAS